MERKRLAILHPMLFGAVVCFGGATIFAQTVTSWTPTATTIPDFQGAVLVSNLLPDELVPISVSLKLQNRADLETVATAVRSGTASGISHDQYLSQYAPSQGRSA